MIASSILVLVIAISCCGFVTSVVALLVAIIDVMVVLVFALNPTLVLLVVNIASSIASCTLFLSKLSSFSLILLLDS